MRIPRPPRRDDGFTLVETLVSIAMISVVAAGLTLFYLRSTAATAVQTQAQVANHIAAAAMEQATLMPGDALRAGRPDCAVDIQWAQGPTDPYARAYKLLVPGISRYLGTMSPATDPSSDCPSGTGAIPALLAVPLPIVKQVPTKVNGVAIAYNQVAFVGTCNQPRAGGTCVPPTTSTVPAGWMPMLRVVVAVTWDSARCPVFAGVGTRTCAYITDTLVNQDLDDPTFS